MAEVKRFTQSFGMQVYTDTGVHLGNVVDFVVSKQKIEGVQIKLTGKIVNQYPNLEKFTTSGNTVTLSWEWVKALEDIVIVDSLILEM